MPRSFTSDRAWEFDVGTDALWDRLSTVDDYGRWWPWLRSFDPTGGFAVGARWRCEVAPPLPYVVRFTVHLDHIDDGREAVATVSGDVRGSARLTVQPSDGGSRARLRSELAPANPVLRSFGLVARPVVEWGHDWVLDQGLRQFVGRALPD